MQCPRDLLAPLALGLTIFAAGCAPATTIAGRVTGVVTAGPTCPVERPDVPCPPSPVVGTVRARKADGHTAAITTTDRSGRFTISLPAGRYILEVGSEGSLPTCPATHVTARPHVTTRATIMCDTGIR